MGAADNTVNPNIMTSFEENAKNRYETFFSGFQNW